MTAKEALRKAFEETRRDTDGYVPLRAVQISFSRIRTVFSLRALLSQESEANGT